MVTQTGGDMKLAPVKYLFADREGGKAGESACITTPTLILPRKGGGIFYMGGSGGTLCLWKVVCRQRRHVWRPSGGPDYSGMKYAGAKTGDL